MGSTTSIKGGVYNAIKKTQDYGTLVMFSHTIFSLSFAIISLLIASNGHPKLGVLIWAMVAFLGARTGANAINRVIDAKIDAMNPRTANRQIPQGLMQKGEVIIFTVICFGIMVFAAGKLNIVCLLLSPIALILMTLYSYTKRFTWTCHLVLGITSAAAPVGAWLAVTGEFSFIPLIIGAANTLWVAGFDIIYGSQDYEFDTTHGIHSIPARFGVKGGLLIARGFHIITWILLVILGLLTPILGIVYYVGLILIGILFIAEHCIVSPINLTNVKLASYNINQLISLTFLIFSLISILF